MTTTTNRPPKATTATKPEPPADAVALDAHWAAKMERLRARTAPTYTLRICDDDGAKTRLAQAERLQQRTADDLTLEPDDKQTQDRAAAAAAAVKAAQEAVEAATLATLTFRGLPGPQYRALIKAHKPTEEQAEDGHAWNEDTFPASLIAAASVDGMSEEDAAELMATWSQTEGISLFHAALTPQQDDRTDLGKG